MVRTDEHWRCGGVDKYLAGGDGPPLVLRHHCGQPVVATVICEACGEPLQAQHTTPLTAGAARAAEQPAAPGTTGRA